MVSPLTNALQELQLNPRFAQRITAWRRFPARPVRYASAPPGLQLQLLDALRERGMEQLYVHQAQAIGAALRGEDVVVVTAAASGKTLCYNVPVLNALLQDAQARALYLFPVKALAQDQLHAWRELSADLLPANIAATYDGDTPSSARSQVRQTARVLITNPDMLHLGILPHHTRWQALFAGLKYIIIDEMHTYRGVFGSHVANLLRRLLRICQFYGSRPAFLCCSATIGNPRQLARNLIGRPVTLVDEDGSPQTERHFILYSPPLVDPAHGVRRSLILETATVADFFLSRRLSTIVFGRGRLATELLLTYLRGAAEKRGEPRQRIRGYRGGYLPRERRAIERGLRDGSVRGVVSTNALELGVDIGNLSVCLLTGYPGTIASTWQQAGRAGRRQDVSAAVLVGGPSALDQYLLSHPQFLFDRTPEQALLAPGNPLLLQSHLKCAAFELPIADDESSWETADATELLEQLARDEGVLRRVERRWYWMSDRYPAQDVSLRTATSDPFTVVQARTGQAIGQVDRPSAPMLIHPGAVYLHEGLPYVVEDLDLDQHVATVRPTEAKYFTEVSRSDKVEVLRQQESEPTGRVSRTRGDVCVRSKATNYKRIAWHTHEQLATVPLDLPEQELHTTAYWLHLHDDLVTARRDDGDWTIAPIRSYGPDWELQRQRARDRDGYRCCICGRPEPPGREHAVHHLQPFRTFDYRPGENTNYVQANVLPNLITLCPECHPRVEATIAVQGTLEGLSSLLAALAPLYVMCDPHDLGVTSDLDFRATRSPTVVIYDTVPGGIGLSDALYQLHDDLLHMCLRWISECPCEEGCPACIGAPPQTGAGAKMRVKRLLEIIVPGG